MLISTLYLRAKYLLILLALPWIIWQGRQLKKNIIELPDADGKHFGRARCSDPDSDAHSQSGKSFAGQRLTLKFLHIGESTVSGVGVHNYQQGLSANIANHIAERNVNTHRSSLSKSGIRLKPLIEKVEQQGGELNDLDFIIVTLGVNDATALISNHQWRKQLNQLVEVLRKIHGSDIKIFFSQVPPMQDFPLLNFPLSSLMGNKAQQMNLVLKDLSKRKNIFYIESGVKLTPDYMAEDGFHPNAKGYQHWGKIIADQIMSALS